MTEFASDLGSGDANGTGAQVSGDGYAGEAAATPSQSDGGHVNTEQFQPAQATYLGAPQSWRREIADRHWNRLDRDLREYIHQREAEAHKTITDNGSRLKNFEPFERLVTKYSDRFPQGIAAHDAISYLIEADSRVRADPVAMLPRVAEAYGLDPMQLIPAEHRQQTAALQQHAAQLEKKLAYQTALAGHQLNQARAQWLADQQAAEAQREEEARRHAVEARRSARVNVRSTGASPKTTGTMDDTIEGIASRVYGGR